MRRNAPLYGAALAALLAIQTAAADIATPINIHGQLLSSAGTPVSGSRAYTVTFHDAATDGNALGMEITGSVDVSADGLFNLSLQPPFEIFSTEEVWYALGIDTDEPADSDASDDVFPSRIRVYYVPFAVQAREALFVESNNVGSGSVDNTELHALDGVTGNVQMQIDAIDTAAIAQHTTDIAANAANIATNTADIAGHTTDIATNTANIATNASDIADNTTAIATNTTNIATNTTAIATNTTNIATNTTAIATNTTNISTNATSIALKANSADVYTQVAADAKFLELAGDSMSGALGVDTINEATSSNGVVVDGVKLQDNFVELAAIAAPGDTTGKLYRTGADLFWNGSQINGGGGADTDTIQWSAFYLYDLDAPITAMRRTMLKAGTILDFQVSCGQAATNGWTVDLLINGVTILDTAPFAFVGDSIQFPDLAETTFSPGDVFELVFGDPTGDMHGVSISIVVEY